MINSPDAVLAFRDVGLRYPNGTVALDGVDLTVARGEFVSLIGPSGCGKSTLLRLAGGLETATAGEVSSDPTHVGFVFQEATLLPWRSVRRNVSLFAELDGMPRTRIDAAVDRALDVVGLRGVEKSKPYQLSGGMAMRVSLARSLVTDPGLFLFDEPFGALDEFTRERLNDEVQRMFVSSGFAGVFVTHSIAEAVFMGSRVVVMGARPGRIVREFEVPFDFPRTPELRYSDEFAALCRDISLALGEVMHG